MSVPFDLPSADELSSSIALPVRVLDEGVLAFDLVGEDGVVTVVLDGPGRSVPCRWTSGGASILEVVGWRARSASPPAH